MTITMMKIRDSMMTMMMKDSEICRQEEFRESE